MIDLRMVYPSRYNETRGEELLYSPLALAYVARHTPDHYRITLDDEYVGEKVDAARLKADLVAFSPITPGISRAYELADKLRARGITCVAGGAHVTALQDEALQHFDAVFGRSRRQHVRRADEPEAAPHGDQFFLSVVPGETLDLR